MGSARPDSGVILVGRASDDTESLVFQIEPFITGGFTIFIHYSGHHGSGHTGAGVWPTVEKSKEIAEESAARLLKGGVIAWEQPQQP